MSRRSDDARAHLPRRLQDLRLGQYASPTRRTAQKSPVPSVVTSLMLREITGQLTTGSTGQVSQHQNPTKGARARPNQVAAPPYLQRSGPPTTQASSNNSSSSGAPRPSANSDLRPVKKTVIRKTRLDVRNEFVVEPVGYRNNENEGDEEGRYLVGECVGWRYMKGPGQARGQGMFCHLAQFSKFSSI